VFPRAEAAAKRTPRAAAALRIRPPAAVPRQEASADLARRDVGRDRAAALLMALCLDLHAQQREGRDHPCSRRSGLLKVAATTGAVVAHNASANLFIGPPLTAA